MNATDKAKVTDAFAAGLRAARAAHPEVPFPAATVEKFAWERWVKFCERLDPSKLEDPRFETQAPDVVRFFLLDEVVLFEKVKRMDKR